MELPTKSKLMFGKLFCESAVNTKSSFKVFGKFVMKGLSDCIKTKIDKKHI